jgi:4-amino-4-deoxy-L-arabinose transferase-like glycosyltransferase
MPQRSMTIIFVPLLGLLTLAAVQLFPGLGASPIERAEIYFLDGARNMVERQDYLIPYYRNQQFFDKPALTYWLMAASFQAFGFTLAAARLVSALVALLALTATVWLGVQLFDRRAAMYGGILLATTLGFVSFGRLAMSDMLLMLWSTLAMGLAVAAFRDGAASGWYVPVLGAVLGLGFQTKGPVALLLPGLGILVLLWQRRQQRWPITLGPLLLALALLIVIGLGWFTMIYLRLGPEPLAHFFLRENLQRFAASTYDVGRRAWWFYAPAYLAFGLPWSPFLAVAGWHAWRGSAENRHSRLLLWWIGLMLVLLSLSRGKIDYYLLPLLPPASLVIGHYFGAVPWGRLDRIWGRVVLLLAGLLVAVAPAAIWQLPSDWLPPPALFLALALLLLGGSLACVLATRSITPQRTLVAMSSAAVLLFLSVNAVFLPTFRAAQPQQAVVEAVLRVRQQHPDAALIFCEDHARLQRDLLFYARITAQRRCDLKAAATSAPPLLLLLQPDERAALVTLRGLGEYRYLPASALTLRGFLAGLHPSTVMLVANQTLEARGGSEVKRLAASPNVLK